jgi:DNA-directed RNA polymerase specialized sigma24 family protein
MERSRENIDAFAALWRADYWPLQRYLSRRLPADDVEEALAEAFLVAWRRIDDVPPEHLPWMYGVARRIVANQRRSVRRRARLLAQLAGRRPAPGAEPATGGPDSVVAALAMLSASDQEVLRLIAWEELEPVACAVVLGCSRAAFDVRLHRARARFEGALAHLDAEARIASPKTAEGAE